MGRHRFHKPHTEWRRGRRLLFVRFVGLFGVMVLLVLGGMAAVAYVLTRLVGGGGRMAVLVWGTGCGLAMAMPLVAGLIALWAFRGIATPIADVMTAADAVAEGDLSSRVPVPTHGPDAFGRLAESFNRMAAELERSDQRRRSLTADVAHELRTPLQIIQGNLEGVLDGVYEPTDEHLEATLDETRLLARLVDDLRTLSLAETGQLQLELESVDVAELLADVATSFSGQAEAAGIDLRVEAPGPDSTSDPSREPPITVVVDVGRLNQVLGNLLANAVRHTPSGGAITIRAEAAPDRVRISVGDSGEGIPPEDLPFVFDRFWRGDRARTRTGGAGSGLGLAIARQLMRAHGGRIYVASEVGRGSTFMIELPTDGVPTAVAG